MSVTLHLTFDRDDERYIVSASELNAYGVADSPLEALNDWWDRVEDLYNKLIESEATLSDDLKRQLDVLRQINGARLKNQ